jgi:hypothetical protein
MSVSGEQRLKRLRELIDHLERLPASAEQERMLREVRARLVDVDTGVTPRAMLPVGPEPTPPAHADPPAIRRSTPAARTPVGGRRTRGAVALPEPAEPARVAPNEAVPRGRPDVPRAGSSFATAAVRAPLLGPDELLSLDDSALFAPDGDARVERPSFPWTRGLRG